MKKRVSLLLLATGLFIAGATFTAKAGEEKCTAKKEASCCSKEKKSCDKKDDTKKCEKKAETTEKK